MARLEAEEAALRAAAEHAHEREVLLERAQAAEASAASLGAQLERHGLVAQLAAGGASLKVAPAKLKLQLIRDAKARGYEGDSCPECGALTMVRNGSCLKCVSCGGTSGCS